MKNKALYLSVFVLYILNSVEYIIGRLYALGENVFGKKLLPDFIWDYCNSAYYKEAGSVRFIITYVIFLILVIVFLVTFRKNVSRATTGMFSATALTPLLYLLSSFKDNGYFVIIMFAINVVHIVLTIICSAKELKRK